MAKVYQKKAKRLQLDDYVPVPLGMRCSPDGTVSVDGRASAALRSQVSTWWRIS